jgi:hypothetical protein
VQGTGWTCLEHGQCTWPPPPRALRAAIDILITVYRRRFAARAAEPPL